MTEMLTAKDIQEILQVDRSTIYRMAEAKQLPAVKVGRQWRFPANRITEWLQTQSAAPANNNSTYQVTDKSDFESLISLECVQLIQDGFAEALGAMIITTDIKGNPVTHVSNPCGLFKVVEQTPDAIHKCIDDWAYLGEILSLEPKFILSHLGLLGARGLVRIGTELKGMVIIGGVAPEKWPPSREQVEAMAAEFGIEADLLSNHLDEVFHLDDHQKTTALSLAQRIADIVAHVATERATLMGKLQSIANLVNP